MGAGALLLESQLIALFVDFEVLFLSELTSKLQVESQGVVEAEHLVTREGVATLGLDVGDERLQPSQALLQRCAETVLLRSDDARDRLLLLE